MPLRPGAIAFGPENGKLTVETKRQGAAAKAGHDLLIEVTSWSGTIDVADPPERTTVELTADARSLRVREGTGGIQTLDDDDKAGIEKTIDDEVLTGTPIAFTSTSFEPGGPEGGPARVTGELELAGERRPISFELTAADGRLTGTAILRQSDWGMKPYSALFGTLKVADEVEVAIDAALPD
jgi:polyisoprenoid-binding protein YceI